RSVDLEAEPPLQHLLPADLDTANICRWPVDKGRSRPLCKLSGRRVHHTIDGLDNRLTDRELRYVLEERIHGQVIVAGIIPLRTQVEIVRQVRKQTRIVAARRER